MVMYCVATLELARKPSLDSMSIENWDFSVGIGAEMELERSEAEGVYGRTGAEEGKGGMGAPGPEGGGGGAGE